MERLKQKVASSSSKVIASLASAASTQTTPPQQQQQQQQQQQLSPQLSPQLLATSRKQLALAGDECASLLQRSPDATAHLTLEERAILNKVLLKEQQFKRDALNQINNSSAARSASGASGGGGAVSAAAALWRRASSARASAPPASAATPTAGAPSSAGSNLRARSACAANASDTPTRSAATPAASTQHCRSCTKAICTSVGGGGGEAFRVCSSCRSYVCEDCASYSRANEQTQHWICSSCRRRATQASLAPSILKELGLNCAPHLQQQQQQSPLQRPTSVAKRLPLRNNARCGSSQQEPPPELQQRNSSGAAAAAASSAAVADARTRQRLAAGKSQSNPAATVTATAGRATRAADAAAASIQQQPTLEKRRNSGRAQRPLLLSGGEQMPLRRLSDQSNLVRRGAGDSNAGEFASAANEPMLAARRNRSHSNIDSAARAVSQSPQLASLFVQTHQQQQQQQQPPFGGAWLATQQHSTPQLEALVTSSSAAAYDSSASLNAAAAAAPTNRAVSASELSTQQPQHSMPLLASNNAADGSSQQQLYFQPQINIPSVSVSEFSNQHSISRTASNSLAASSNNEAASFNADPFRRRSVGGSMNEKSSQQMADAHLHAAALFTQQQQQRRSSCGRVLPRVPGEQAASLSMLNLPHGSAGLGADPHGGDGAAHAASLGLPALSQAMRRASAPEGQNIRIIVDDIDGSLTGCGAVSAAHSAPFAVIQQQEQQQQPPQHCNGNNNNAYRVSISSGVCQHQTNGAGADAQAAQFEAAVHKQPTAAQFYQRQFCERIVLYADESLDSATGAPRGFGLRVMGGDIADGRPNSSAAAAADWPPAFARVCHVSAGGPAEKAGLKPGDLIVEWNEHSLVNRTYDQVVAVIEASGRVAELIVRPAAQQLGAPSGSASFARSASAQQRRRLSQQLPAALKLLQQTGGAPSALSGARKLPRVPPLNAPSGAHNSSFESVACRQQQQQPPPQQHLAASQADVLHASSTQALSPSPLLTASNAELDDWRDQQSHSAGELRPQQQQVALHLQRRLSSSCGIGSEQLATDSVNHWLAANTGNTGDGSALLSIQQQQQSAFNNDMLSSTSAGGGRISEHPLGSLALQVTIDESLSQLELCILNATGVATHCVTHSNSAYFVKVSLLPQSDRFKSCTSNLSSDLTWMETFIFQNFPTHLAQQMTLRIGIWQLLVHTNESYLLGEAVVPIEVARRKTADFFPIYSPSLNPAHLQRRISVQVLASARKDSQTSLLATNGGGGGVGHQQRQRSASNRNLPDSSVNVRLTSGAVSSGHAACRRASDEVRRRSSTKMNSLGLSPARGRRALSAANVATTTAEVGGGGGGGNRRNSRNQLIAQAVAVASSYRASLSESPTCGGRAISAVASEVQKNQRRPSNDLPPQQLSQHTPSAAETEHQQAARRQSKVASGASVRSSQQQDYATCAAATTVPKPTQLRLSRQDSMNRTKASSGSNREPLLSRSKAAAAVATNSTQREERKQSSSSATAKDSIRRKSSLASITLRKFKRTLGGSIDKRSLSSFDEDLQRGAANATPGSLHSESPLIDVGVPRVLACRNDIVGKLTLGVVLSKGFLELNVIRGEDLEIDYKCPGIYMKMYLKSNKCRVHKRKTKVVPPSSNPSFNSKIKYDASLIDNKYLEISLWHKKSKLMGKVSIGFTETKLDELNLAQFVRVFQFNLHAGLPTSRISSSFDVN